MKKIICIVIAIMILLSCATVLAADEDEKQFPLTSGSTGPLVIQVQQRLKELGYISYRATGKYGDMTYKGVLKFQQLNDLPADGMCGKNTYDKMFDENAVRNSGNDKVPRIFGPLKNAALNPGILADFHETIDNIFKTGDTVTVTDYNTGKTFRMKRTGGANHADVKTIDSSSFATYKTIFNGANTWERRAVLVEIGGQQYAASIIGMPTRSISGSTMDGTVDMYFWGSTADFVNLKDVEHATACKAANGQ